MSRLRLASWRAKAQLREVARRVAWLLQLRVPRLRARGRQRPLVLAYHTASDEPLPAYPSNVLPVAAFRHQMKLLASSGRPVLPLQELVDRAGAPATGSPGAVALTFDDGYRPCLETVAPILRQHGFPATFFVCTGPLDRRDAKWDDLLYLGMERFEKPILRQPRAVIDALVADVVANRGEALRSRCASALLSWDEVREISRQGFSVQSHTADHYWLAAQSPEDQHAELVVSKRRLEEELGEAMELLAYPFGSAGSFDSTTQQAARSCGYGAALAGHDGYLDRASSPFALPRFGVSRRLPPWRFELILSGFAL